MPRASCRCGEPLDVPDLANVREGESVRVVCPKCGAKVKIRKSVVPRAPALGDGDGYIRFFCPCGRRLKVPAARPPAQGKCPDCGRIVPVPAARLAGHPEAPTVDLDPADVEALE